MGSVTQSSSKERLNSVAFLGSGKRWRSENWLGAAESEQGPGSEAGTEIRGW